MMKAARAILVGVGLALAVVAGAVAALIVHSGGLGAPHTEVTPDSVAVALVLPNTDGASVPRAIDVYEPQGAGWAVRSADPSASVIVPGTSGQTLMDAFSFGGGPGLVSALGQVESPAPVHWVVVDEATFAKLHPMPVDLVMPQDIEVFDGHHLYSYAEGAASVPVAQMRDVGDAVEYLGPDGARSLRQQLGDVVRSALSSASPAQVRGAHSDVASGELTSLLGQFGRAQRVDGR